MTFGLESGSPIDTLHISGYLRLRPYFEKKSAGHGQIPWIVIYLRTIWQVHIRTFVVIRLAEFRGSGNGSIRQFDC